MIFRLPSGDNLRLAGVRALTLDFAVLAAGCGGLRSFAHLALCASAILLLAAADSVLFGRRAPLMAPRSLLPSRPSITDIAFCNFSTCNCA